MSSPLLPCRRHCPSTEEPIDTPPHTQAFVSQRQTAYVLATCIALVAVALALYSALYDNTFLHIGPNDTLLFMRIKIDSWSKWTALTAFVVVTQGLKVLADEIISPWIVNTIMDHKCVSVAFGYRDAQLICQTYYLFASTVKFITISITISQIDLVAVLIATDMLVSVYTTHCYLKCKTTQQASCFTHAPPPPSEGD